MPLGPAAEVLDHLAQMPPPVGGKAGIRSLGQEAERRLWRYRAATYMALHRLAKAGWLIMPRSGFCAIPIP
jgi:hypothetical protein